MDRERRRRRAWGACLVVGLIAPAALGQAPPPLGLAWATLPRPPLLGADRPEGPVVADLVGYRAVGRDLKLDPEQERAIRADLERAVPWRDYRRLANRVRNVASRQAAGRATPAELAAARADLDQARAARAEAVRRHLDPAQARRLEQIARQRVGIRVLREPVVAARMNLTAEQQARVAAILDGRDAGRDAIIARHRRPADAEDARRNAEIARRLAANRPVTPEERASFDAMYARGDRLGKELEGYEDGLDDALYALLNAVQKARLRSLFGPLIDIDEQPPAEAAPAGATPPARPRA